MTLPVWNDDESISWLTDEEAEARQAREKARVQKMYQRQYGLQYGKPKSPLDELRERWLS